MYCTPRATTKSKPVKYINVFSIQIYTHNNILNFVLIYEIIFYTFKLMYNINLI